jgi:cytochrome c oxidase subunit 2
MEVWWPMARAFGCASRYFRRPAFLRSPRRRLDHRSFDWRLSLLGALALLGVPQVASAAASSPLLPASPNAAAIANLFWGILIVAGLIFIGVEATIIIAVIKFRQRPGAQPAQFAGSTLIEVTWTAIPALILAGVFFFTVRTMYLANPPLTDPLNVNVTGHQWWWQVDYPNEKIHTANEIHVPVGEPVVLHLTSADVIHSVWIPQLAGKRDANPGFVNTITFTVTEPGVYLGRCAELCGVEHAWMQIRVIAMTPSDYAAWVKMEQTPAPVPSTALIQQGQAIYASETCANCHAINAGPNLTHVGSRLYLGGGVLQNTPQNMYLWLQNPDAVKPGTHMPNYHFTSAQLQALTAYLESLK